MDDECPHYDQKVHHKLYQNCNRFILRKYDGRIKKSRGCNKSFKTSGSATPEFVIAHRELYVYGRIKGSKRVLIAERDYFYHYRMFSNRLKFNAEKTELLLVRHKTQPITTGWSWTRFPTWSTYYHC